MNGGQDVRRLGDSREAVYPDHRGMRSLCVAVLMVLAMLAPGASASASGSLNSKSTVHPYVQYTNQVNPNQPLRLIVQKTSPLINNLTLALGVGGSVVEDFSFINAVVLDVPPLLVPVLQTLPGVKYISLDAPVIPLAIDATDLSTTYEPSIGVPSVWNGTAGTPSATGAGVGVAVLDTGLNTTLPDFSGPGVFAVNTNPRATNAQDGHGHGTHVAGTIKGRDPQGRYIGVAPDSTLVSVKISDDAGNTTESDLIRGLQWVNANKASFNLRVVNLSVSTTVPTSYLASPVSLAAEQLWRSGVVVVAASGNNGKVHDATWAAPGNDPYLVTVGALDTNDTAAAGDDSLAPFSSYGKTQDGVYKPDVVAPGRRIVAPLAGPNSILAQQMPDRVTDGRYIRLSGTSMSSPIAAGVVALILQRYPTLSADQVKWLLTNTDRNYAGMPDKAGAIDAVAALKRAAAGNVGKANQGLLPSGGGLLTVTGLLGTTTNLLGGLLGSVTGLLLDTRYWDGGYWDNGYWDAAHWDAAHWDAAHWDAAHWDAAHWDAAHWDAAHWDAAHWDAAHWDSGYWDAAHYD